MAIEKQDNTPDPIDSLPGSEDMTVVLDAVKEANEEEFELQEDGSAILGGMEDIPVDDGFGSNLAALV